MIEFDHEPDCKEDDDRSLWTISHMAKNKIILGVRACHCKNANIEWTEHRNIEDALVYILLFTKTTRKEVFVVNHEEKRKNVTRHIKSFLNYVRHLKLNV